MRPSLIVRHPRVLSTRSRCLFGFLSSLLLGMLLLGSPPSVAAQTCAENSTAVNNRGAALAGDCTTLLGLMDTLRGTATLNWATTLNMDSWDGITVAGNPARVTKLEDLYDISGTIPAALRQPDRPDADFFLQLRLKPPIDREHPLPIGQPDQPDGA